MLVLNSKKKKLSIFKIDENKLVKYFINEHYRLHIIWEPLQCFSFDFSFSIQLSIKKNNKNKNQQTKIIDTHCMLGSFVKKN